MKKNTDYKIEVDEFIVSAVAHKNLLQGNNLDKVFDMIDHDQSGEINLAKFKMIFSDKVQQKK